MSKANLLKKALKVSGHQIKFLVEIRIIRYNYIVWMDGSVINCHVQESRQTEVQNPKMSLYSQEFVDTAHVPIYSRHLQLTTDNC